MEGLRPHQRYQFRIMAKNIEGSSDPSDPTEEIMTDMAPPEGPPANVTMRPQNHSTLIINWEVSRFAVSLRIMIDRSKFCH